MESMVHYIKDFPSLCPPVNNKRNIHMSQDKSWSFQKHPENTDSVGD